MASSCTSADDAFVNSIFSNEEDVVLVEGIGPSLILRNTSITVAQVASQVGDKRKAEEQEEGVPKELRFSEEIESNDVERGVDIVGQEVIRRDLRFPDLKELDRLIGYLKERICDKGKYVGLSEHRIKYLVSITIPVEDYQALLDAPTKIQIDLKWQLKQSPTDKVLTKKLKDIETKENSKKRQLWKQTKIEFYESIYPKLTELCSLWREFQLKKGFSVIVIPKAKPLDKQTRSSSSTSYNWY